MGSLCLVELKPLVAAWPTPILGPVFRGLLMGPQHIQLWGSKGGRHLRPPIMPHITGSQAHSKIKSTS